MTTIPSFAAAPGPQRPMATGPGLAAGPGPAVTPAGVVRQSLVLASRSLAKSRRSPGPAINGIVTPALFLVLFASLFGASVSGTAGDYLQYLFPGMVVMSAITTGLLSTGANLAADLRSGMADRLRSLPVSRLAPLLGSVLADTVRYLVCVLVLFAIGLALGFRTHGSALAVVGAVGLAIGFGFCLSWAGVLVATLTRDAGAVAAVNFLTFLPLQLGTSLAVPTSALPGWLRAWADVNPVTHAMDACRALLTGTPATPALTATLIWCGVLLLAFGPLAVATYRRQQ